ncbi:MAG: hypothetical protein KC506_03110 [Nanoarchaeota archaeon]|nr:hypothetical protein [Nanoarchaeota archaeon]
MQHKFKRHQKVRLLINPDPEYVEYDLTHENSQAPIKKGMTGQINMLLPNGQYHVEIIDPESNKTIAYVPIDEEFLEAIE